jgi:hypothetical protein
MKRFETCIGGPLVSCLKGSRLDLLSDEADLDVHSGAMNIMIVGFRLDLLSVEEDDECAMMCSDCLRCTMGEDQRCCGERDCVVTEFSRAVKEKDFQSNMRKFWNRGSGAEKRGLKCSAWAAECNRRRARASGCIPCYCTLPPPH